MGTNYYARINKCESCGRFDKIHIGKSSIGWRFAVEIHEEYYKSLEELWKFLDKLDVELFNEYGERKDIEEFFNLIENKKDGRSRFENYPEYKYADCEDADLQKGSFS